MREIRILGIVGSLRRDSANAALVRAAAGLAAPGVVVEPWCGLAVVPPFDEDAEHDTPAAVADLRCAISAVDAILISTPEYNGSVPGQLKNAMDWASRPYGDSVLTGTLVAITSASPSGYGAAWAAEHLSQVIAASGGSVLEQRFSLPSAHTAFADDGRLADPAHEAALTALLRELADTAAASRSTRLAA